MEFLQPYINIWKNFAKFDGRTGVRGFWMAFVVNMIIGLLFGVLTQISGIFGILSSAYSLAVLVPWWALMFRRLHDIGKPGGWAFLSLTCIGVIPLIIWFVRAGDPEENLYGSVPEE